MSLSNTQALRQEPSAPVEGMLSIDATLRSLPDDTTHKKPARPPRSQKSRRIYSEKYNIHSGAPVSPDHSRSSIGSSSTATTHVSSVSSVVHGIESFSQPNRNRCHPDFQPVGQRNASPRYLPRVHQKRRTDFHASDSQLLDGSAPTLSALAEAKTHFHSSAPSQLDYSTIEEEIESEESKMRLLHLRESKKAYAEKLSEQLRLLDKRVQKMTSRELMELSETIGAPIAFSHERGLQLVDKEESMLDFARLTKTLQRILRERKY